MTSEPPPLPQGRHLQVAGGAGIVTVRLQRAAERNALSPALIAELTAVARALARRVDVHAVVLSGGAGIFSAGMDLKAARALLGDGSRGLDGDGGGAGSADGGGDNGSAGRPGARRPTLLEQRELLRAGPDMTDAWEAIEGVTIAALEGWCLGGGAALALACDFRVAGAQAAMRLPEVALGMNMSWHALPRLAALVGPARAKRMAILGEAVDAERMLAWGLVDEIAPAGGAEAAALRWAGRAAELPPLAVRMTKQALNAAVAAQREALAFADRDQFLLAAQSMDLREGIDAFFEKRRARFVGD